jgi:PAS domain S-box-containing protein
METKTRNRNQAVIFSLQIALLALLYFTSGKVGLSFAYATKQVSSVWPASGIALAILLLFGIRFWPGILIGAFLVNLSTKEPPIAAFLIACGNVLAPAAAFWLLKKYKFRTSIDRLHEILGLILFAALISTAISATIGTATLLLSSLIFFANFSSVWLTWWVGDMMGILIVAPLILVWSHSGRLLQILRRFGEFLVLLFFVALMSYFVFKLNLGGNSNYISSAFVILPFIIWSALRFEVLGVVTANFIVSTIAVAGTLAGKGPFSANSADVEQNLINFQIFEFVFATSALLLGGALSERRYAEIQLEQREEKWRYLIEYSYDAFALIDEKAKITYVSPSVKKILGYTPKEFMKFNVLSLVHSDEVEGMKKALAASVAKPARPIRIKVRAKHKDGSWRWVEAINTNFLGNPAVNAIVVTFHDITESKNTEESLRRFNDQLSEEKASSEVLLGSIGEGMLATDKNRVIILINKVFEEMLGLKRIEAVGKKTFEIIGMEDEKGQPIPEGTRPLTRSLATGQRMADTFYLVRKDGTRFPASITTAPVVVNNQIIGAVQIFRDVTIEKEIDQRKTEFISVASHQLRTPLSILKWYISRILYLGNKIPTKALKRYLEEIYGANQRMIGLTNDLLNVSRMELGKLGNTPYQTNLNQTIKSTVDQYNHLIDQKNLKVDLNLGKPLNFKLDPNLFRMLVQNLFSNAIKYSPSGSKIKMNLSLEGNEILLSVSDQGFGISAKDRRKLFEKFYRSDRARKADPDGSGLGLYIVSGIVKELEGRIWFDSVEGKGTTFYVIIPAKT